MYLKLGLIRGGGAGARRAGGFWDGISIEVVSYLSIFYVIIFRKLLLTQGGSRVVLTGDTAPLSTDLGYG